MRRSTEPGADGWPCSGVVRNRYAEDEATAPAAMTPLMKPRRDTDSDVSSDIFLSSIAGSPRRVVDRPDREGFDPAHDNAYGALVQRLFRQNCRATRTFHGNQRAAAVQVGLHSVSSRLVRARAARLSANVAACCFVLRIPIFSVLVLTHFADVPGRGGHRD